MNKKFNSKLKILILGLSYKENVADFRNSKAVEIAKKLKSKYSNITFCDPLMNNSVAKEYDLKLKDIKSIKKKYDLVLLLVPHKIIISKIMNNIEKYTNHNSVIMDIKSSLKLSNVAKRDIWML